MRNLTETILVDSYGNMGENKLHQLAILFSYKFWNYFSF